MVVLPSSLDPQGSMIISFLSMQIGRSSSTIVQRNPDPIVFCTESCILKLNLFLVFLRPSG